MKRESGRTLAALLLPLWLLLAGCQNKAALLWDGRVGSYDYDHAIVELGPPDKEATTSEGVTVAQWMVARSRTFLRNPAFNYWSPTGGSMGDVSTTPDIFLQLTFGKDRRLTAWKKVMK